MLDTSVVIGFDAIEVERLPLEIFVSALTLAELAAGPTATTDTAERARRIDRLQRTEATFESIPFDQACARAYGRVYAATAAVGRKPRGTRTLDLLIAAVALARDLPLYTLNAAGLRGLGDLVEIVDLG